MNSSEYSGLEWFRKARVKGASLLLFALESLEIIKSALAGDFTLELLEAVEGHARCIPHTDFGLCTLLFQDSVGGLEVDPFHTGDFKPALPVPGTVLINIADLMQRLTNDRCRSTMHRVVGPKASGPMLPERYSMPFFIHPDPEAMINPITKEADEVKRYQAVNAGEWRIYNTKKNYLNLTSATV